MKVKRLKIDNFARFSDFEVEFGDMVTHLVGMNGAGKTTVGLTAIWACLKGIAEKSKDGQLIGERFRFVGPKKATADLELTLIDEAKGGAEIKVRNRIAKDANHISFEAPKGYPINNGWLNNLLSVAFLSAKNFTAMTPKEQALLLGIDVSSFDAEMKGLKDEYTLANREYRGIGELTPVAKAEPVNIAKLLMQKGEIDKWNAEQDAREREIEKATELIGRLQAEEKDLERRLKELRSRIDAGREHIEKLPKPEERKDDTEVVKAMQNAEAANRAANAYKVYCDKKEMKEAKRAELEAIKEKQATLEQERIDFIRGFQFGFDGLSVDEDGGLLLDGRPIKEPYYSKGELEVIVAKLYASQNPDLKLRFIDDFELLDEDNQKKLIETLIADGFQIITARVGKESSEDNVVLLRECKKVDEYKEKLG